MSRTRHFSSIVFAWLALFALTPAASGQTYWDGGSAGTGAGWATAANWFGNVLPTAGSDIVFDGVTGAGMLPSTGLAMASDFTLGLITFDNLNGRLPSSLNVFPNFNLTVTPRTLTINTGITLANSNTTVTFLGTVTNGGVLSVALTNNVAFTASPGGTLAINPVISGLGHRVSILGGGTVALNGANLFTGGVTVAGGSTLNISHSSGLGGLPGAYDPDNLLLNNGTLRVNSNVVSPGVALTAVRGITITPNGATLSSPSAAASLTVASPILESGGIGRLTITGGGSVTLQGNSTGAGGYSGGIAVTTAGTVFSVGITSALGVAPVSFVPDHFVLNTGTTFAYSNSGGTVGATRGWQIGPTTGNGTATISLTRTTPGATLRIDGIIADQPGGSGGLNVNGTGNLLTLTGANTYTGPTTLAGATLYVNGDQSAATGPVAVNSGTLGGNNGTLGGAISVNALGTLKAGTATVPAGTLNAANGAGFAPASTFGVHILAANAAFTDPEFGISGVPGTHNNLLNVTGTLTIPSGIIVAIDASAVTSFDPTGQTTYSYKIAQATSVNGVTTGIPFTDAIFVPTGFVGSNYSLNADGLGGLYVNFNASPVPEPTSIFLFSLAGLATARATRRK